MYTTGPTHMLTLPNLCLWVSEMDQSYSDGIGECSSVHRDATPVVIKTTEKWDLIYNNICSGSHCS